MSNNDQTTGTASPDAFPIIEVVDEGMLYLGLSKARRACTYIGQPLGESSPVVFDLGTGEVR